MEVPKKTWRSRRVVIAAALIIVVASASLYAYSAYASPGVKCEFVPGNDLYLHIVSSNSSQSAAGLGVKGWLYELCPISSSGSAPSNPKSTVLGNWNFMTNATGYVTVPSSDLAGWSFTFNVPYEGQIYQFNAQVCGGGTTTVELFLPSGSVNGTTSGLGESVSVASNGTQMVRACGIGGFFENATIS